MRPGKMSESILRRSVLKKVNILNKKSSRNIHMGQDGTYVDLDNPNLVVTSHVVDLSEYRCGDRIVNLVANNLYASNAKPYGMTLNILLADKSSEQELKDIMDLVLEACEAHNMCLLSGHTEVSSAVTRPVLSATGFGLLEDDTFFQKKAQPGDGIVLTKFIGLDGTALLAHEKYEEFTQYFPRYLVDEALKYGDYTSCKQEVEIARDYQVTAMHDLSHGGVFGGLWEFAQANDIGLDIDIKSIAIRQETVEICERLGLNPYRIRSMGSMLIACEKPEEFVSALRNNHIEASIIGYATDSNDRVLKNGEDIRFLETPQADEIYQIIGGRM